ncbi:hypothetical protein LTR10_015127 [Elasticomyces elasticus]|uniref:AB hydrolase-1 domain-containing protein n=1 Tax=Exophiala sideris TaxID=1016849 RepID=A0ABR0JQZ3_9EURO|nr:hypothetical protein LTR10_015127 [Elasticomyces elasticus]KAK5034675.1 hypothetical protein LTR13_006331 [Exophiala sideris]KAK5040003.1 hypothetical protein LTS07_000498 [Exophiala sideris]KAK5068381.1 hypothetical protein LTR69_000499 [Exophiala sideris]KAK5187683.1 hypothetical protein LTR44_000499 [Eurotiomycetes sp. CCFEE 6388]
MGKPSILLVPGSFCLPEFYTQVLEPVSSKGYEIKGLHLPTVGLRAREGRQGPAPTMYDDAAFIDKAVEEFADQGKDVIVIGHSYGGVPISQCGKGLSIKERQQQGKSGGLVRLGYMTCLVPPIGGTAVSVLSKAPSENQVDMPTDEKGWMLQAQPEKTAATILQTIPAEEGTALVWKFPKHSAVSFTNELTYAGYKHVPVSYLFCEEDLCIPPFVQREGIEIIEGESGRKVDVTSIKADHCPNWSATQAMVDWIVDVAEKTQKDTV